METGSATALATVTLMAMLPGIFLSPFIGALVDRWNRRRIMLFADSGIALTSPATAMTPISLARAGPLSDAFGIQIWFLIGGVVTILMGLGSFAIPTVMRIEGGKPTTA